MLMKTLARLSGLLIGITASHAEPAGPDGAIILDKTHYEYCQDNSNRIVSTAQPPYYVALRCINFHSTDPLLATKCSSYMKYSYCTAQECEKEVYRNSKPSPLGGSATMQNVCATTDGYGGFDIIRPIAQEQITQPSTEADDEPATDGANVQPDACKHSAFLFTKMATASANCNFQTSKTLTAYLYTATSFCGKGPPSAWPGSKSGAMAFFDEVKKQGKGNVCARIGGEMIGLENITTETNSFKEARAAPNVEQLISQERRLDAQCRGNGTDCVARQKLAWQLQNLGWCWGKTNQIGADMQWHKCTRDSQKMTLKDLHSYDDEIR